MQEKELIKRVKRRKKNAELELYNQYKNLWFGICLRYNSNRQNAEDALQNALVNIFTKIKQFDEEKGSFKSWSSRIVVNENLALLRKNVRSFKEEDVDSEIAIFDETESPIEVLSAKELTILINQLPDGYRTVFNLYAIEGFTHVEIAETLNIAVGTSKSQLSKARKMLQHRLEVLI